MQMVRPGNERGRAQWGWLDSRHTFSFGDYFDPKHMGFGPLRVINEDRVAPGGGFPQHPHRDMEIISYVLSGALEHEDSIGNGSVIRPGEIQYMSAGTGVLHSEYNASRSEPVEFLQIWIIPERRGTEPAYAQKKIDDASRTNTWALLASPDGRQESISIKRDALVLTSKLDAGERLSYEPGSERGLWLQVAAGAVEIDSGDDVLALSRGDGVALLQEPLKLRARDDADLLLFDLEAP